MCHSPGWGDGEITLGQSVRRTGTIPQGGMCGRLRLSLWPRREKPQAATDGEFHFERCSARHQRNEDAADLRQSAGRKGSSTRRRAARLQIPKKHVLRSHEK